MGDKDQMKELKINELHDKNSIEIQKKNESEGSHGSVLKYLMKIFWRLFNLYLIICLITSAFFIIMLFIFFFAIDYMVPIVKNSNLVSNDLNDDEIRNYLYYLLGYYFGTVLFNIIVCYLIKKLIVENQLEE